MKKTILRSICLTLALVLVAAIGFVPSPAQATEPAASELSIQDGVTLHCWNWSFNQITENLDSIVAMGYTAIQTSPIQAAKEQTAERPFNNWWAFYQPASFSIDNSEQSALGTKADFEKMCKAAHDRGLKVIVDVVANHMGNATKNDLASTIIPDLRNDSSCWHDISKNTTNYNDRFNITQYCMDGLPDLNTSSEKVQNYVLNFLKECIDAGADGFRFDGAKHIETPDDSGCASHFWPTVINGAKEYAQTTRNLDLYCYGEVLDYPGGSLSISSYTKYMNVTDNSWGLSVLKNVVCNEDPNAYSSSYNKSANASQLVVWAESHDDFAANSGHTRNISEENINKAWALIASRADSMGLYLARPDSMSQYLGVASISGWAHPEVAAVNKFHTAFAGQSEYLSKENGIAYVERGDSGVVLVNCKGTDVSVMVSAKTMANGTYTDAITGNNFIVEDGIISGKIGSTGIAVVYNTDACAHSVHTIDGICTSCSALVEHTYTDGTCTCGKKETVYRTVYFVNSANWKTVNFYYWYTSEQGGIVAWPGSPMTQVKGNIYSCSIPNDVVNIIFNGGSSQTDDLQVPSEDSGKNMYDFTTKQWSSYATEEPTEPTQPSSNDITGEGTNGMNPVIWIAIAGILVAAAIIVTVVQVKKRW